MSTSANPQQSQSAKGPRMCRAIVDLGGDIMRDILFFHIKPAVIMSHILTSNYFRNHPLNPHQMSVLANTSSKGDYSDCDVTLVYSLIRNCGPTSTALRPTSGWGKHVNTVDISLGDDIERIRIIRNEIYGHIATTALSDNIYNQYMTELQVICRRMDTTHAGLLLSPTPRTQTYSQMLRDIQVVCMDPEMEARYTEELRRMKESDIGTRQLISELKNDVSGNRFVYALPHMYMPVLCCTFENLYIKNLICKSRLHGINMK